MALIYIEYISRKPGVDLELFHTVAGGGQTGWADDYAARDQNILNLGRTWRMGAEPEYMAVWNSPNDGLDRLDEWETIFRSGEADRLRGTLPARRPHRHRRLLRGAARARARLARSLLLRALRDRAGRDARRRPRLLRGAARRGTATLELNLVCDRIGALGPDPRGLAVWGTPSFAALDTIVRELDGVSEPIRLVRAGLYCDFGKETL